jgi:hypothetical protein
MAELHKTRFGGLFVQISAGGRPRLSRHPAPPPSLTDPHTGQPLKIATVEVAGAICPSCDERSEGGFVSFVADLRMVYACPQCQELVWVHGA